MPHRAMKEKPAEVKKGPDKVEGVKQQPPDGGWGWIVVLGVSIVNLSTRPIEPSFGLLFGDLLTSLSIATTGAGIIVSTYEAVINFSGLLVGPLIKSYSYRKVAILGGVLTGVGLVATYPAASMTHILCTYSIINGLGIGFSSSSTFVSLNHYFKKRRGQAVGITMTGTGLGLMLMPQAVRLLTEEYDFAGSILILGAFSLNACVGASLLQPVKWHLRNPTPEEGPLVLPQENKSTQLEITKNVTHTISEKDEDQEEEKDSNGNHTEEKAPRKPEKEIFKERISRNQRKFSIIRQSSIAEENSKNVDGGTLKTSSTETRLDSLKETKSGIGRKFSEVTNGQIKSLQQDFDPALPQMTPSIRRRKGSVISNLSNMDFHGSGLQIHAVKHEVITDIMPTASKKHTPDEGKGSLWSRFSAFMDLDLLKDPVFLNIMFGLSIFYVAELNFKMVVPFFLADRGHSKSETAFCLSIMAASDIVARIVLPPICDRIMKKISRRTMFMIATIFCALSRSALAESGEVIQLETIMLISGFFRGATLINFMLVISEYCDEKMDKLPAAFGLHMVAKGLFIVAFGPLIGLIRDKTNSYPICIHAQSLCILLCSIAWCLEYGISSFRKPKTSETSS